MCGDLNEERRTHTQTHKYAVDQNVCVFSTKKTENFVKTSYLLVPPGLGNECGVDVIVQQRGMLLSK